MLLQCCNPMKLYTILITMDGADVAHLSKPELGTCSYFQFFLQKSAFFSVSWIWLGTSYFNSLSRSRLLYYSEIRAWMLLFELHCITANHVCPAMLKTVPVPPPPPSSHPQTFTLSPIPASRPFALSPLSSSLLHPPLSLPFSLPPLSLSLTLLHAPIRLLYRVQQFPLRLFPYGKFDFAPRTLISRGDFIKLPEFAQFGFREVLLCDSLTSLAILGNLT